MYRVMSHFQMQRAARLVIIISVVILFFDKGLDTQKPRPVHLELESESVKSYTLSSSAKQA